VAELERLPGLRLLTLIPSLSFISLDLISSPAIFRTNTAPSFSASLWIVSSRPYLLIRAPCSSLASQMLRTIRRRLSRTTALLDCSFRRMRWKRSGWARLNATGGLSRNSFCKGSNKFSKALAFEVVKHLMIAVGKDPSRRCSSTLAVSSCSLWYISIHYYYHEA